MTHTKKKMNILTWNRFDKKNIDFYIFIQFKTG
jgi:hypothetical protein